MNPEPTCSRRVMPVVPHPACWLLLAVGMTGCQTREISEFQVDEMTSAVRRATETGTPQLVFEDDFERDALGDSWRRGEGEDGSGRWRIDEGWVTGSDIKNDPLWLREKLPPRVRVEFDAQALSSVGDLKVEIFGDGVHHESGYILIFGGWNNSLDVIARLDEHGRDRKERASKGVRPRRTYRMAIERGDDGRLVWKVDGEEFMTYDDDEPLRGPGHRHFAFNDWTAPVRFDNVRVYALP